MEITISTCTAVAMLRDFGTDKEKWQNAFSEILGCPIELPYFFWEVELAAYSGHLPLSISIHTGLERSWLSVFYHGNLWNALKKNARADLLRKYHLVSIGNNNREDTRSGHIPCGLPSHNDESAETESAQ